VNTPYSAAWLTIPQMYAHFGITADEWDEIRVCGSAPLHLAGADGQPRVGASHPEPWLDGPATAAEIMAALRADLNERAALVIDQADADASDQARADVSGSTTAEPYVTPILHARQGGRS
jgi:hypothetical protein